MKGSWLKSSPCTPLLLTDRRVVEGVQPVAPKQVSRMKTSKVTLVSPLTRLSDSESYTTKRPVGLIRPLKLVRLPMVPPVETEAAVVEGVHAPAPIHVSRTKMSDVPLVSPLTRLLENEPKEMNRPSSLTKASSLKSLPSTPP